MVSWRRLHVKGFRLIVYWRQTLFGLLIFSRSRPAQLDLLLSSLEKYSLTNFEVNVLYKNDKEYEEGYNRFHFYHPYVNLIEETDFCNQTKEILSRYEFCGISTDDCICCKEFEFKSKHMIGVDVFSLRYGLNTTLQHWADNSIQPALVKYTDESETICWDTRLHHALNNYGFIFGSDCHIYSKRYLQLIKDVDFKSINQLESYLFNNCRDKINPFIRSFRQSVVFNCPGNNQSGQTKTDNSLNFEEINKKFLLGQRFDLSCLDNVKIVGAHQICPLTMM